MLAPRRRVVEQVPHRDPGPWRAGANAGGPAGAPLHHHAVAFFRVRGARHDLQAGDGGDGGKGNGGCEPATPIWCVADDASEDVRDMAIKPDGVEARAGELGK